MTTKRRGICPVCDREYDVTKAGVMRDHWAPEAAREREQWQCNGVGLVPSRFVVDPIAEAEDRGYRRAVQALRGQNDELVWAIAEVTQEHYIDADLCVCQHWGDGKDGPGWDQHIAEVTLKFLADHLESLAAAPRNEGAQT